MATPNPSPYLVEENSWHLLSLLLQIGHPIHGEYLSYRCRSFYASPDFICYVVSLPNSPLQFKSDRLLFPSCNVAITVTGFFPCRDPTKHACYLTH